MLSIVRTLRERGGERPKVTWIHAARRAQDDALRPLAEVSQGAPWLRLVHVYEEPPPGWTGPSGRIDAGLLRQHLPSAGGPPDVFICGPGPMMDAVESALLALSVPANRIHTERYELV
jgi:ferredoxin-NADP reductase